MLYDNFIRKFLEKHNCFDSVESVMRTVRSSLDFRDAPSLEMSRNGIVDCVGSAAILQQVLSLIFPSEKFRVCSVPELPWLPSIFDDSRHCVVVRLNSKGIQFIDATPINGYGYGKISLLIPYKMWSQDGNIWRLKHQESLDSILFWENYLYPSFIILDSEEVDSIAILNNTRLSLSKGIASYLPNNLIFVNSKGWLKEFFRSMAKNNLLVGNKKLAKYYFIKALDISPNNSYLLSETIRLIDSYDLRERQKKISHLLIEKHSLIESIWSKHARKLWKDKKWYQYTYYLGASFWRRQSISLLKSVTPEMINVINLMSNKMYLYQFSPSWFDRNEYMILLTNNRKILSTYSVLYERSIKLDLDRQLYNSMFLRVPKNCFEGYLYLTIINKKNNNTIHPNTCIAKNSIQAHYWFVGLLLPEVLIV